VLDFNNQIMMLMVLPAIITAVGHGMFRFFAGEGIGHTLANSSLIIAFMITLLIYYGFPTLQVRTNTDQLFFICLISLVFGFLQDRYPKINVLSPQVHIALMILVVFWIYTNNTAFPIMSGNIYALAVITIMAIILFLKLEEIQYNALQAPVSLFWVAVGLFVVAKSADIPVSENIMMIFIAALGCYLILNFPKPKFPFGASALYPGFLVVLSVAMQMYSVDPSLILSLLILTTIFYSENLIGLLNNEYATPLIRLIMPAFPIAFAWALS
jgi:hypothetical protein